MSTLTKRVARATTTKSSSVVHSTACVTGRHGPTGRHVRKRATVAAFATAPAMSPINPLTWPLAPVAIMKLNRVARMNVAHLIASGRNGPSGQHVHAIVMAVVAIVHEQKARGWFIFDES